METILEENYSRGDIYSYVTKTIEKVLASKPYLNKQGIMNKINFMLIKNF